MPAPRREGLRGQPRLHRFDGIAFGLYLLLILVSAIGLAAADWADHLALIPPLALLAVCTGAALARSRFSDGVSRLISSLYALFFIGWFLGLTMDPALSWMARASALFHRLGAFVSAFAASRPNPDTLMFVLIMAALYWLLASYGAVALFRRGHIWRAILPPGFALLLNAYYDLGHSRPGSYVAIYLLLTFLIIVRMELADRRSGWHARRIRVPAALGWDLGRVTVVAAILMVTAAWAGPAFAQSKAASNLWSDVSGPWRAARDRLGNAVANLRSPVLYVGDAYGASLQLSAGTELDDRVVMDIEPTNPLKSGGRFYWQARTYAEYQRGSWTSVPQSLRDFDPRQGDLPQPEWGARQDVEITFRPHFSILSRLYVPSDTYWVDRTSQVSFTPLANGRQDPTTFVARQPLYDGDSYTARASIPVPTVTQLQGAGTDYPDWVRTAYLDVPEGITERFRALAESLGQGQSTPFDQATTVTDWLRANIQYSRVTEAPPPNQDPLDWFVFDYKIGFCNFYASSEVMMLRVLGVPARLAVGYASGTPETSSGVYEVRAVDSHAWPEVFFPGFGWIPFEPTASQPEIQRPENSGSLTADQSQSAGGVSGLNPEDPLARLNRFEEGQPLGGAAGGPPASGGITPWATLPLVGGGLVLVLSLLAVNLDPAWKQSIKLASVKGMRRFGVRISRKQALALEQSQVDTSRVYLAWSSWLPRLGVAVERADTPFERFDRLASHLPVAETSSRRIVEAYVAERFGGRPVESDEVERTWSELHRLFWSTYLSQLGRRLLALVQDPQRVARARREQAGSPSG